MQMCWAQLALNLIWPPVFFGAQQFGLAFVVILLMLATILGFIATAWRLDGAATWLFVLYGAYVG
jgi:tryptophan-rich sensory protein